jgi:hypothetical protein
LLMDRMRDIFSTKFSSSLKRDSESAGGLGKYVYSVTWHL